MLYKNMILAESGLVMYCTMDGLDESQTFLDELGVHTLTALQQAQVDVSIRKFGSGSAKFGNVYDCITFPQHANFNFGVGNFTIEFWVYFNSIVPFLQALIQINAHYGMYVRTIYQKVNILISNEGSLWETNVTSVSDVFVPGQWQHVAIVRTGSDWQVYVDNVSVVSATNVGSLAYDISKTNGIGVEAATDGDFTDAIDPNELQGYIDELAIYNVALTTQQIADHYNFVETSEVSTENTLFFGMDF
jgi:hypothetical protein